MSALVVTAEVTSTIGVDLSAIAGRLAERAVRVLDKHGKLMLRTARDQWRGWEYKGTPKKARGRSGLAWRREVQATEGTRTITIQNAARSYYGHKPYVGHVHRAGSAVLEHEVLFVRLVAEHLEPLKVELTRAALATIGQVGPPKKVRVRKAATAKQITITM